MTVTGVTTMSFVSVSSNTAVDSTLPLCMHAQHHSQLAQHTATCTAAKRLGSSCCKLATIRACEHIQFCSNNHTKLKLEKVMTLVNVEVLVQRRCFSYLVI
eukprot:16470-Heterococcus_DN1.PRE.5